MDLRHRRLWTFVGRLGLALIVALSLLPLPASPLDVEQGDKLGHALAYFAITAWYAQLVATRRALVLHAIAFAALGVVLEVLQTLTGWRHGNDPLDMLANLAGVLAGMVVGLTPARNVLAWVERRVG